MGEDSLLERVTAAAEEIIARAAAEGLVRETFPVERGGEFYEEAPRGRSARLHRL
jgi:hypothetical protein